MSGASPDGVEDASLWSPLLSRPEADGRDGKELGGHAAPATWPQPHVPALPAPSRRGGGSSPRGRRVACLPQAQGGPRIKSGPACVGIIPGTRELGSGPQCAAY